MTARERQSPFKLDLITLLVQELRGACAFYEQHLDMTVEESGTVPDPLALRLGYPTLKGAAYAGLSGMAGARLRLIATADAPRLRPAKGWHAVICAASNHSGAVNTLRHDTASDPDNHRLLHEGGANRANCVRGISLETEQAGDDAAFYQGLLGATLSNGPTSSRQVRLSEFGSIHLATAALQSTTARPLSVRLRRLKAGSEAIPQLTALARCLRGPQDEIIELI